MCRKKLSVATVAVFFAVLLAPLAQMALGWPQLKPIDENRKLAPKPTRGGDVHETFVRAQKWFDDHYGLREFFIRLKTQADYSLFRQSSRIHVGSDGFLFYRNEYRRFAIEEFLAARGPDLLRGAQRLDQYLKARNRRLVIVFAPSKEIIYSEMLPRTYPHFPHPSRMDGLRADLARIPGLIFIDPTDMLLELKRIRPVFYRTDWHWNTPAAFEVAKMLVDRLAIEEGRRDSPWTFPLEVSMRPFSGGGEALFIPLFRPAEESAPVAKPTWGAHKVRTVKHNNDPFGTSHFAAGAQEGLLPCAVVVHDSFWGMMDDPAAANFQAMHLARWSYFRNFDDVLQAEPGCKYFIYQFMQHNEPALHLLADFNR